LFGKYTKCLKGKFAFNSDFPWDVVELNAFVTVYSNITVEEFKSFLYFLIEN